MRPPVAAPHRTTPRIAWLVRGVWLLLPPVLGVAAADTVDGWGGAPRTVAEAMLWTAWAGVLVVVFAPRPAGLTALRLASAAALGLAGVTAPEADTGVAAACLAGSVLAVALAVSAEVGEWLVNGVAYGDERRFLLRTPAVLALVAAPVASLVVVTGVAVGPLLLADGRVGTGLPVLVAGLGAAAFLARSLHSLSRRWLVHVPGGLVVHDPLVAADPVLLPRSAIRRLATWEGPAPAGVADLRLGARGPALLVELHGPLPFPFRRARAGVEVAPVEGVLVCPARLGAVLERAARRGLPVGTRD